MKKHRLLQAALAAFILIAAFGVYRYMVVTKPVAEKNKAKKSVVHVRADTVALRDYDVAYSCFAKVHAGATVPAQLGGQRRIVAGRSRCAKARVSGRGTCSSGFMTTTCARR